MWGLRVSVTISGLLLGSLPPDTLVLFWYRDYFNIGSISANLMAVVRFTQVNVLYYDDTPNPCLDCRLFTVYFRSSHPAALMRLHSAKLRGR
jgi:hypothetical protein